MKKKERVKGKEIERKRRGGDPEMGIVSREEEGDGGERGGGGRGGGGKGEKKRR